MSSSFVCMDSPVGRLRLQASDHALTAICWTPDRPGRVAMGEATLCEAHPILQETRRQLAEYFAGARRAFTLPLAPAGTEFQQRVWQQLRAIPYGQTCSYGELARALGDLKRTRAVGAANARNPLSIVVPCHRVVGAAGSLVGFAGGLAAKRTLLALESQAPRLFDLPA